MNIWRCGDPTYMTIATCRDGVGMRKGMRWWSSMSEVCISGLCRRQSERRIKKSYAQLSKEAHVCNTIFVSRTMDGQSTDGATLTPCALHVLPCKRMWE